jgi:hypothetical protein
MRPLVQFARPVMNKSLKSAGFVLEDVVLRWHEIVGEELAPFTLPLKIIWGKRPKEQSTQDPGTLYLRVESGVILEVQHQKNVILERVNSYFGWQAVSQLKTTQGIVQKNPPSKAPVASLIEKRRVAKVVGDFDDEALKNALLSYGQHIYAVKKSL